MVNASAIYVREDRRIYSLTDGSVLWSSALPAPYGWTTSDYAGGYVVTETGPVVSIEQP